MSGYLQRLARSVTQPAETVHPRLGSVFAPADYLRTSEPVEQNLTVQSREPAAPPVKQPEEDRDLRSPQLLPIQTIITTPLIVEASAAPTSDEHAAFLPMLKPGPREDSTAEHKRGADAAATLTPTLDVRRPVPPQTLLMTPATKRQPDPAIAKSSTNGAASRRATGRFRQHIEPKQDDVQIHIGRIEVTAVQQASARAPSKPLHKGTSLDEYLKRRDRRA